MVTVNNCTCVCTRLSRTAGQAAIVFGMDDVSRAMKNLSLYDKDEWRNLYLLFSAELETSTGHSRKNPQGNFSLLLSCGDRGLREVCVFPCLLFAAMGADCSLPQSSFKNIAQSKTLPFLFFLLGPVKRLGRSRWVKQHFPGHQQIWWQKWASSPEHPSVCVAPLPGFLPLTRS